MVLPGICFSQLCCCLCWLPSQAGSPFVTVRWLPAAPSSCLASLTTLVQRVSFQNPLTDWPNMVYDPNPESITVTLLGWTLLLCSLVEGEVGVSLSEPHGLRVGEGWFPKGSYYQQRGIGCWSTQNNSFCLFVCF